MRDYCICTDSTADLPAELIKELGVTVVPLNYTIDGKEFIDDVSSELSSHEFYEQVRAGKQPNTSQATEYVFSELFNKIIADGKDILYIAFSSALSGTYHSSMMAAEKAAEEHPDFKVISVDSKCASLGEGMLVYLAAQQKKAGKSIEEVRDWLEENKLNLCHWFTVYDLFHLKRGGRLSAATAIVGTMLGIKPVLHVDDEGRLINVGKVRGRKASLDALVDHMEQTAINPAEQTVFISHGDSLKDAQYVASEVKRRMRVKDVIIGNIGPVIGTHSGPDTVALFFMGSKR